jgi:cell division septation protein DedD
VSLVGVVTTVISEITGAVASVVVVALSVVVLSDVVEGPPSLLVQEMTVRLKIDMRII